ncbi:MAG: DUF4388 domain-containing protein [Acidobacteriota bacterium]
MKSPELGKVGKPGKAVAWVGSLSQTPLADVLGRVAYEEKSGDLQVICGDAIKTIYFDRGFVVFAASNLKSDRLGDGMIQQGRISRHQFALASMLMKGGGGRRRFGEALVQAGVMSEEELGRQVALQVNRIVLSLFTLNEGIYSLDQRPSIIPVDLMVSLSIYRILLEGIRRMTNGKLIVAGLPPLNTTVRVSERPPFTIDFDKLKPVEQAVLLGAGRGASMASLVRSLEQDRGTVLRACYGLYASGLLEGAGRGASKRPLKVQEETGVFLLSDIQKKFAKVEATNTRQEILMEFGRLDHIAESELLKVDREAPPEEIHEAYDKQKREWEEKRRLIQDQESLVMKVETIQARLQQAYRRVLKERESVQEVAGTRAESPPTPAEAVSSQVPSPDAAAPASLPLGEAVSAGSTTTRRLEDPSPPQRKLRLEQLLRDVQLHFQVQDWEPAVSLLHELVGLDPTNATLHGMLARAIARHPVLRKDAERHFIEALRLDPQSADLHYALGLYYKSFGRNSRAETELRTALRIDPGHEGARKHLFSDRRRKDPLRDMFKKIFG